jgi:hypothetical protein
MYRKGRQDASELGETQQGKGRSRASCLPGRGRKRDRGILVLVLCAMYVIWTRVNLQMGSAVVLTRQEEAAPVLEASVEHTHLNKVPHAEKRKDESGECRADAFLNDFAYAEFETTAGSFSLMLRPDLAPHGCLSACVHVCLSVCLLLHLYACPPYCLITRSLHLPGLSTS